MLRHLRLGGKTGHIARDAVGKTTASLVRDSGSCRRLQLVPIRRAWAAGPETVLWRAGRVIGLLFGTVGAWCSVQRAGRQAWTGVERVRCKRLRVPDDDEASVLSCRRGHGGGQRVAEVQALASSPLASPSSPLSSLACSARAFTVLVAFGPPYAPAKVSASVWLHPAHRYSEGSLPPLSASLPSARDLEIPFSLSLRPVCNCARSVRSPNDISLGIAETARVTAVTSQRTHRQTPSCPPNTRDDQVLGPRSSIFFRCPGINRIRVSEDLSLAQPRSFRCSRNRNVPLSLYGDWSIRIALACATATASPRFSGLLSLRSPQARTSHLRLRSAAY